MTAERRFLPTAAAKMSVVTREDGGKTLAGYAAVFFREGDPTTEYQLWDGVVERIGRGAFNRAISEKHDARALFNHQPDNLLGRVSARTVKLSVDDAGLRYEIPFDPEDVDHQRVLRKIERGDLSGSSFAFIPTRTNWIVTEDQTVRMIEDLYLFDVGPVTYPAYEGTTAAARAEGTVESAREDYTAWRLSADAVDFRLKKVEFDESIASGVN